MTDFHTGNGAAEAAELPILRAVGLAKRFGALWALRDVSFELRGGEFLTLFGPNGAGKTTLIRTLAGLSKPTSGAVLLADGGRLVAGAEARQRLGFISHQPLLYPDLTAEENLVFFARLYGVEAAAARVADLLERVGLSHRATDPVRQFSRGMQQRLALARALLHDPGLLLLDEPYTGLDPTAMDWLTRMLDELAAEGHTVLMTSHDLERGAALADRVAILAAGRLAYSAEAAHLALGELAAVYAATCAPAGRVGRA